MANNKETYYRLKNEGKCVVCYRDRGNDGTTTRCRLCANKMIIRQRKRQKQRKALGLCIQCGQPAIGTNWCEKCRLKRCKVVILSHAKGRAKKKGVPFDVTYKEIEWNIVCPVLGIPLVYLNKKLSDNSPSLDRFIPELGYVKENIEIISMKANRVKNNATVEEIRKLLAWMEKRV